MFRRWIIFSVIFVIFLVVPAIVDTAVPESKTTPQDKSLLKIALLQMQPDGNNQSANMDKAERFCRQAADLSADIALMPEMWNIGYTSFDAKKEDALEGFRQQAVSTEHPSIQRFARLAKELNMAIAVTYEQAWNPCPRNTVTLFDRHGKEVLTYAKVHTCDFQTMEASMTPGEDFFVTNLDTRIGPVKVGAMICYDREQPESARILMLKGAELILTPNACGLDDLRLVQFRVRAVENVCHVAMTNYPSPKENGHSVAYNAGGECVVMAGEKEGLFIATFDMESLRQRRRNSIWGNAFRRPRRYKAMLSAEKDDVWKRNNAFGEPFNLNVR
ncbi:MAG: carbon-nitrogen hydrolase family protein [Sedimentisphaerales bacterium]|nr:carbon-nitrogen hydrolase family protein [Sedimentisphaerales bacterium]